MWKHRKSLVSFSLDSIFFKMKALAPLSFSTAAVIGLFFSVDLTIMLDFIVFLTDSLVRLVASINRENEEKGKFSK